MPPRRIVPTLVPDDGPTGNLASKKSHHGKWAGKSPGLRHHFERMDALYAKYGSKRKRKHKHSTKKKKKKKGRFFKGVQIHKKPEDAPQPSVATKKKKKNNCRISGGTLRPTCISDI